MTAEWSLGGVMLPPLLVAAALAALGMAAFRRGMLAGGLYRFVWHPALFDLAVFVLLLGALDGLMTGWMGGAR